LRNSHLPLPRLKILGERRRPRRKELIMKSQTRCLGLFVAFAMLACLGPIEEAASGPSGDGFRGRVVYVPADIRSMYVLDLPAGTITDITPSGPQVMFGPAWSRDGEWITFVGGRPLNVQIYVMKADGSGLKNLTGSTYLGGADLSVPTFSPDGNRIAFQRVYGNIYIINRDGTNLVNTGVRGGHVRWSPDGTRILFTNWGFTYTSDLFVYDLRDGSVTQVTYHQGNAAFVFGAWSPDSKRLAATWLDPSTRKGDILVLNVDGTGTPVNLTSDLTNSSEGIVAWTADGKHIVFLSNMAGNSDVWAMKPDGTGRTNLTNSPHVNESWAHVTALPDTTPPVVSLSVTPTRLWPPNHKMSSIDLGLTVSDDGDPDPWVEVDIRSSEPDDAQGNGDGATTGDIRLAFTDEIYSSSPSEPTVSWSGYLSDFELSFDELLLRAECAGEGDGRTYTVEVTVTDASGNATTEFETVSVPHDAK
jgi:hypothetical protein